MGSEAPGRSCGGARDRQQVTLRRALRLTAVALIALAVGPSSVAGAPAAVTLTVEIKGQGRVVSEPAGLIDCPRDCTAQLAGNTTVRLRGEAAAGWAVREEWFGCDAGPLCTVAIDSDTRVEAHFLPAGTLQLWPAGEGDLEVSPAGIEYTGDPVPVCRQINISEQEGCLVRYVPGTRVTVTGRPAGGITFLGWSTFACRGTGPCQVVVPATQTSLVGRFTPLRLNVVRGGNGTGSIVSEPPGIACPDVCSNVRFAAGTPVTLVARPDPAAPFVAWKFGCTVSPSDPNRCTVRMTSHPQWVGVSLGEDDDLQPPATVSVLFGVVREGRGTVAGGQIDCGERCDARYGFGRLETLRARPAGGWRFTRWMGACEPRPSCTLIVGPVTTLGAAFTENLAPRLVDLAVRRRAGRREIVVRVGVTHAARAVVRLRREGGRVLPTKTYVLKGGVTTLVRPVARTVPAGRYRVTVSLSDGLGGGRTFTRVRMLGRR